jgi:SHS2 domain-containing protein
VQPSYEFFDHTADMGIRVRAGTLEQLLFPAAQGLYAAIGEIATMGDVSALPIEFDGDDAAVLLRDFLTELLILFEREARKAVAIDVTEFDGKTLRVMAATAAVDPQRSVFHREVKAITYHELSIRAIAGGFEATLIVDI